MSDDLNAVTDKANLAAQDFNKYNTLKNFPNPDANTFDGLGAYSTAPVPVGPSNYGLNGPSPVVTLGTSTLNSDRSITRNPINPNGLDTGVHDNLPALKIGASGNGNPADASQPAKLAPGEGVGGKSIFVIKPVNTSYGSGAVIELMPARRSFTPTQGQMVPGAGAGLEIRVKSNIAKLPIPGARPVYQHMGISEEVISFVGAFAGFDLPTRDTTDYSTAYDEAMGVVEAIRDGYELELTMEWEGGPALTYERATTAGKDGATSTSPAIKYRGYVRHFVKEFATAQKVYYRVEMVVTNRDIRRLNEKATPSSLQPSEILGGVFGLQAAATNAKDKPNVQGKPPEKPRKQSTVINLPDAKTGGQEATDAPLPVQPVGMRSENGVMHVVYNSSYGDYTSPTEQITENSIPVIFAGAGGGSVKIAAPNGKTQLSTKFIYHPSTNSVDVTGKNGHTSTYTYHELFGDTPFNIQFTGAQQNYDKKMKGGKN